MAQPSPQLTNPQTPLMDERAVLDAINLLAMRSPLMETLQQCIKGFRRLEQEDSLVGTQIHIIFHGGRGEHSRDFARPKCNLVIHP